MRNLYFNNQLKTNNIFTL